MWRATSSITPRQPKRGSSTADTSGTVSPTPLGAARSTSGGSS